MTEQIIIVPGEMRHALMLAESLYQDDYNELLEFGLPKELVISSFLASKISWAAMSEEGVVCMWGVTQDGSILGGHVVWLLTSKLVDKYARHFIRGARLALARLGEEYSYLENFVDSRHNRAIRFLKWLGFDIENDVLKGARGVPFHRFSMRF